MGLLDDAIREHLELKRRHGGDPTEIERAQREALGPVRRSPEPADQEVPAESAGEELRSGEPSDDLEPDYPLAEKDEEWEPVDENVGMAERSSLGPEELPPYESASMQREEPLVEEPPFAAHGSGPDAPSRLSDDAPEWDAQPRSQSHSVDPPAGGDLEQETVEYELEPEDEAADDVLESTPDFLQDTPDHDRLWFEQRPPRDFDFDG